MCAKLAFSSAIYYSVLEEIYPILTGFPNHL